MSRVVALCGGVGGAKLASGLAELLPGQDLLIAVNTGDDFQHLGLSICPDIDSTLYAISGLNDVERGWGRRDETWHFMAALAQLGGPGWFNLGDRDLATHVWRTTRRAAGASLSQVTGEMALALGISCRIVPMSDDPVSTVVETDAGRLAFQDYFVRHRCLPVIRAIDYEGAGAATIQPELKQALESAELQCVIICPSNPWLSIAPLLAIPSLRRALGACRAPVLAVSPIVGGRALKGPTDKIMRELGWPVSAAGLARFYVEIVDGFVIDEQDRSQTGSISALGCEAIVASTVMTDATSRRNLAQAVIEAATRCPRRRPPC
jgi:LPPG:FO 2-phospho-L-lactate transferase